MIQFKDETRIVLYSARYEESRQFYEQVLKLKVVKDWDHGNGLLGVVYAMGNTFLEILQGAANPAAGDFYIYSKVENIDQLWEELRQRAPVVETIQTQPWGYRNFSINDPNGYKLKFFSEQ